MSMITQHLGLALLTGAALVSLEAIGSEDSKATPVRQGKKAVQQAGKMFQRNCISCHVIPNPAVRTDRGWLDQINRTT